MLIDCDSCTARPRACGDCIVTHLLQVGPARGGTEDSWSRPWDPAGPDLLDDLPDAPAVGGPAGTAVAPAGPGGAGAPELTDSEVAAVAVLSAGGLVPPLRLVSPSRTPAPEAPAGRGGQPARPRARRDGTRAG